MMPTSPAIATAMGAAAAARSRSCRRCLLEAGEGEGEVLSGDTVKALRSPLLEQLGTDPSCLSKKRRW